MIPALNNPLEHLPFMGVDRPQDVWGGIKTANSLLSDGNLVLSAVNQGITDRSVLTSFGGRFTNLTFSETHSEMRHEHTRDEPTVLRSGGTMTFETERTHFKGLHQAQGNLAIQTEHLTSEPLVETDRREQRSETTSVSFNPLTMSVGFSGQEGTGRGFHKQHQRTHVISEETLTLNANTADLMGTQMRGRTLEGRVGQMTLRHVADEHEEEQHQSSYGVNISFMPEMMQGLPMPSIAENDNEDFEHVIRQGRSGLHANDNLMQITEQEEFADEEYHHQDSSSFAFHPGELVSLVQNFQQFSENFETLVATLRPANTYKTEQEEQVLEAYHQTQVNDAKETLTELAERLRESRKDAVERVVNRLEKENMRRKEEGKPTLHPESAEVQEIIQEEAAEYQERADHHLNKVARYGEDQVWDAPVSAAFEQALECARAETENATSFLDTIKGHLKQWVIKEVHASLEEMGEDQNKSTGTLVLETGISVATDVTTGLVLNKAVQGAGKLISSGAKTIAQTPWGRKTTQFITEKSTQILNKGLSKLGRTQKTGVWKEVPIERGKIIEKKLGQNLPDNFPTIDKFDFKTGTVTSIKSLDLNAPTYQSSSKLQARVKRYIDQVSEFKGGRLGETNIESYQVKERALEFVIPNPGNSTQSSLLRFAKEYAESKGVRLDIIIKPY